MEKNGLKTNRVLRWRSWFDFIIFERVSSGRFSSCDQLDPFFFFQTQKKRRRRRCRQTKVKINTAIFPCSLAIGLFFSSFYPLFSYSSSFGSGLRRVSVKSNKRMVNKTGRKKGVRYVFTFPLGGPNESTPWEWKIIDFADASQQRWTSSRTNTRTNLNKNVVNSPAKDFAFAQRWCGRWGGRCSIVIFCHDATRKNKAH